MCLAIPGRVVKIEGDYAIVDFLGQKRKVRLSVVKPKVNDYVIVKYGTIVEIVDEKSAKESIETWKSLKEEDL
ncbi:MAG: HypC/HybG/HupF family hydrogenase formation chaperone [Candidatus Aenigmarchaeota archaeon]|nr:HypC/HybG/HupF family hydrogenase formation chaperone [Candidatus Aenigmarchaeota archaeon]